MAAEQPAKRGKLLRSDKEETASSFISSNITLDTNGVCDGCKLEMKGMLIVLKSDPARACVRACVGVMLQRVGGGGGGASGPDAIHS